MSLVGLLILIVIAALCGVVAEILVGFSPGGFLASTAVGFVGALLGTLIARSVGLPSLIVISVEGWRFDVLWAVIGAILFLVVLIGIRRTAYGRRTLP